LTQSDGYIHILIIFNVIRHEIIDVNAKINKNKSILSFKNEGVSDLKILFDYILLFLLLDFNLENDNQGQTLVS